MKKIIFGILLVMFVIATNVIALAKDSKITVPEDIRVGLFYSSSAKSSVRLSSPGGIEIGVMSNGKFIYEDETNENEEIVVTKSSKSGAIHIDGYGDIGSSSEYPYFKSIEKNGSSIIVVDGKKYRGNIEIRRLAESDMTVINHLSMQEYLYGVVPREIGGNSPIEAVKAQAIVARTYAAKNYGRRSKLGFDVMPTVDDQAYGGYEWENSNSNRAVDETIGQVVAYDGELIGGYYFSTSGGYTENSENVWSNSVDYLKAVPDTYEPVIEGNTSWEVSLTADEVKNKMSNYGINVGEIVDLVPTKLTDVGRVLELKIVGTNGEKTISKSNVRTYLGLKSQWYTINDDAPVVGTNSVKANDITRDEEEIEETENIELTNNSKEEKTDDKWYLKYDNENIKTNTDYSSDESNYTKDLDEAIKNKLEKEEQNKEEQSSEEQNIVVAKKMKPLLSTIINSISMGDLLFKKNTEKEAEYLAGSSKQTFVFRGRGWGHAVGMSQNGAKGMAEEGFTAEEIIKWYYSGVTIEG